MARKGRPINVALQEQVNDAIANFTYRYFGINGKLGYIGSDNLIKLQDRIYETYQPRYYERDGKRMLVSRGQDKRQALKRLREGGIYDKRLEAGGAWNRNGKVSVEKLVRYIFGRDVLEYREHQAGIISGWKVGLSEWGVGRTINAILRNNSDTYEMSDEDEKQVFRELNQAKRVLPANDPRRIFLENKAKSIHREKQARIDELIKEKMMNAIPK